MPHIVALVKHVPDSWSEKTLDESFLLSRGTVDEVIDEINEHAVEQALQIKESNPDDGWVITALTVGTERADAAVRKAIAMGADQAVHVTDEVIAGSDVLGTAWALNGALNAVAEQFGDIDLIIAGNASTDGKMGAIPGILSEYRGIPALTHLTAITVTGGSGGTVTATRLTGRGTSEVQAPLPAILSVTEHFSKPRFPNFKGIMAAKKAQVTTWDAAAVGVDAATVGAANAATVVTAATKRPERTRGEVIHHTGDAAATAAAIADYLAGQNLI